MKESELKNLIKQDNDNFSNDIEVWDRIEQSFKSDIITKEKVNKHSGGKRKTKLAVIFGSISGGAFAAALVLLIVLCSNIPVNPRDNFKVAEHYSTVKSADNLQFQTALDIIYDANSVSKSVNGNIEKDKAHYTVTEEYAGNKLDGEIYTDGKTVYQINQSLNIKYVSNMKASQIYGYAYVLSDFELDWLSDEQIETREEKTYITYNVSLDKLSDMMGDVAEIQELLKSGTVKSAVLTFIINSDNDLSAIELKLELTVSGIKVTVNLAVEFLEIYETPEIIEPDDLGDYSEPSYNIDTALQAYKSANESMFSRDNYKLEASSKLIRNDEFVYNFIWSVASSGSGSESVTYVKNYQVNMSSSITPSSYEVWLCNGIEYKKEVKGDSVLKKKAALNHSQESQLRTYLPMWQELQFSYGEVTRYNGKTYIFLSGSYVAGLRHGLIGFEDSLTLVLDEEDRIISLVYKQGIRDNNAYSDLIIEYEFSLSTQTVSLPDDLHEYENTINKAYSTYSGALQAFMSKPLTRFKIRYLFNEAIESFYAEVSLDRQNEIGRIDYFSDNGNYFVYKNYGFVFGQYYKDGYLYSSVENSPFYIKEACNFSDFLQRVDEVASVLGQSAIRQYQINEIYETVLPDSDYDNALFLFNMSLPQFSNVNGVGLSYSLEFGNLIFLGLSVHKNQESHYITLTDFAEIQSISPPPNLSGYTSI